MNKQQVQLNEDSEEKLQFLDGLNKKNVILLLPLRYDSVLVFVDKASNYSSSASARWEKLVQTIHTCVPEQ